MSLFSKKTTVREKKTTYHVANLLVGMFPHSDLRGLVRSNDELAILQKAYGR